MKCGSCFRCREYWEDAMSKGLKPQNTNRLYLYADKPRRGVKVRCINCQIEYEITTNSKACKDWKLRALWNAHLKMRDIRHKARQVFKICFGRLRKPVKLIWADDYGGRTDGIIRNFVPECPHCGEMAYNTRRCVFCGQRFIQDERTAEWNNPSETVKRNCPFCGRENTLVGERSRINGHFHGTCKKCGHVVIE